MKTPSVISTLATADLTHKRVFLRADLNVALSGLGSGITDHRLQAILPTIDLIQRKGGKVILATHIGRPTGPTPGLSTKNLMPWFQQRGYAMDFEPHLGHAYDQSFFDPKTILLLENMRFFPQEKTGDLPFAQSLARLADWYVNDAFALLHRSDTSITVVPSLFTRETRTIGLLIEQELTLLQKLLHKPKKPFVLICGGGKVADKIPLIQHLLPHIDTLLLCPAIVFTFLKAVKKNVGKSVVDDNSLQVTREMMRTAQEKNINVLFPVDYQVAHQTFNGRLSIVNADEFPADGVGISIGPKTAQLFGDTIRQAQTIFYNGAMGDINRPETLTGLAELFKAIGQSKGLSIVGGGESVAAARLLGLEHTMSSFSTGGGATLAYLSGEPLPGLDIFLHRQ
jgi:phosphoglycerate kinase